MTEDVSIPLALLLQGGWERFFRSVSLSFAYMVVCCIGFRGQFSLWRKPGFLDVLLCINCRWSMINSHLLFELCNRSTISVRSWSQCAQVRWNMNTRWNRIDSGTRMWYGRTYMWHEIPTLLVTTPVQLRPWNWLLHTVCLFHVYSGTSLKWMPWIKDTSLNRTHFPSPSTVLAYISTSELRTPL